MLFQKNQRYKHLTKNPPHRISFEHLKILGSANDRLGFVFWILYLSRNNFLNSIKKAFISYRYESSSLDMPFTITVVKT